MEITTLQIVLVFIVACIAGMGSILDEFQFHRPLIACTLVGIVLGDMKTGTIIGGTLEMIALGWMNIGAAVAPDAALASIISTILVIAGHQSIGAGIALVTNGLNIAGGMIVVVGYAMVINMMRAGYLMPFFYLGFVTAAFTNFNLVALGVIGTVMAVLYIQLSPKYNRVAGAPAQAAGNNDLDNELD